MVSLILVTGLAIWMNPYVTDVLNERTTLPQYVEKKCLETFENNEFLSGENQDVQKKWLESMGVPEELNRRVRQAEYRAACAYMADCGIDEGFTQERRAAQAEYTPPFDLTGV